MTTRRIPKPDILSILQAKFSGDILQRSPHLSAAKADEFMDSDSALMFIDSPSGDIFIYIIQNSVVIGLIISRDYYRISYIHVEDLKKWFKRARRMNFNSMFGIHSIVRSSIGFKAPTRNSIIKDAIQQFFEIVEQLKQESIQPKIRKLIVADRPDVLSIIESRYSGQIIERHPHLAAKDVNEFLDMDAALMFINSTSGHINLYMILNTQVVGLIIGTSSYRVSLIDLDELKEAFKSSNFKRFKVVYADIATTLTEGNFRLGERNAFIRPALEAYFAEVDKLKG